MYYKSYRCLDMKVKNVFYYNNRKKYYTLALVMLKIINLKF